MVGLEGATGASDLRDWQLRLSRTAYRLVVGGLVLIPLVAVFWLPRTYLPSVGIAFGVGLLGVLLLRAPGVTQRLRSWYLVSSLALALVVFILQLGWTPVNTATSFLLVSLAVLLLGRRAFYVVAAGITAAFLAGGALIRAGVLDIDGRAIDPTVLDHWLRSGTLFLLITSVMVAMLRFAMTSMRRLHASTRELLEETAAETMRSEALRSERAAREDELRDSYRSQAIRHLAHGLAHHFNNILTVVRFAVDELRAEATPEAAQRLARRIQQITEQGVTLLSDLTAFSRRDPVEPKRVDVGAEVLGHREGLISALREDVRVTISADEGCLAELSPEGLRQVLLSLVLNASDAVEAGGTIEVRVQRRELAETPLDAITPIPPGRYVEVSVRDTGEGMEEEVRRRAVEPFFTTRSPEKHSGLGLSTAIGLVEAFGGTLAIESEVGEGTRVRALFPDLEASEAPAREPAPLAGIPTPAAVVSRGPSIGAAPAEATPAPLPGPVAPAAPEDLDDWSHRLVQKMLRVFTVLYFVALAPYPFIQFDRAVLLRSLFGVAGAAILGAIGGWVPGLGRGVRNGLLYASILCVAAPLLVFNSFLSAISVALLSLVAALAAVFSRRWMIVSLLALFALLFLAGGLLHQQGILSVPLEDFSPVHARNWFRVAFMLGTAFTCSGVLTFGVFRGAQRTIEDMTHAIADLEAAQALREEEGEKVERLQQMEARTARIEDMGQLAGAVVHDFNNAIQTLVSSTWILERFEMLDEAGRRRAVLDLEMAADYAETLVEQFTTDSDIVTGADEVVELSSTLQRALRLVERRAPRSIELDFELAPGCHVLSQVRDLNRIVFNLTQNAIHAMPAGGRLTVRTSRDAERVTLVVADDGVGMDARTLEQAFEPFFTTKEKGRGTGLGLAAVRHLIDRSGGSLSVQSAPGEGTRFEVRWPLQSAPGSPARAPAPSSGERRGKVLVAEDHELVRSVFCAILQEAGFEVLQAADGDEARRLVELHADIDLLFTDGVMPGYPSHRLVADFRERYPGRPIVVCSGYLPRELDPGLLRQEFKLLAKPVRSEDLLRAVAEALG
ncbi:MAG: ATP-binding protein [Deltaproteobacteria bacterium]|nr:ATP-binding protein [Deltaproteobacteria bacterium]